MNRAVAFFASIFTLPLLAAGVLIGYSRTDEANGDAPRALMRALDRLPSHRRAAGR